MAPDPSRRLGALTSAAFLTLLVAIALYVARFLFAQRFSTPDLLDDHFHAGEWFLTNVNRLAQVPFDTITIHGGKDLLPAMIAKALLGDPLYIGAMPLIYHGGLTGLTGLVAVVFLWRLAPERRALLFVVPFAIWFAHNANYRDLGFFVFLLAVFTCLFDKARPSVLALMVLSAAAVFSIVYSMNRGAMTGAALAASLGWMTVKVPRLGLAFLFMAVIWTGLGALIPQFAPFHVVQNILFLVQTSDVHASPAEPVHRIYRAYLVVAFLAVLGLNAVRYLSGDRGPRDLGILIFLTVTALCYFEIATSRIGQMRFLAGIQFVLFAVAVWWRAAQAAGGAVTRLEQGLLILLLGASITLHLVLYQDWPDQHYAWQMVIFGMAMMVVFVSNASSRPGIKRPVLIAASVLLIAMLAPALNGLRGYAASGGLAAQYDWAQVVEAAAHVPEDIAWIETELARADATCVFDMTNAGMINAYTGLPTCSRIAYLFYADARFEQEIIADLLAVDPPVVVYSTTFWWDDIDDMTMSERFPGLDAVVRAQYPVETCADTYCLRLKPQGEGQP